MVVNPAQIYFSPLSNGWDRCILTYMNSSEYDKGFHNGWEDALMGFSYDAAYSGAFGEGYLAGWTAATS